MYDDRILIELRSKHVAFRDVLGDCFDGLISAFQAYRGEIYSPEFTVIDFEFSRRLNSRYDVYRILPVSYYSLGLFQSAFSCTPEEARARVGHLVEEFRITPDGVKIIVDSDGTLTPELENRTRTITELLKGFPMER